MTTINPYAERKTKLVECCEDANPVSRHIIDADCRYEDGTFYLIRLPARLPLLFTARFTAPVDYVAGSKIVLKGLEFEVKNRSMADAQEAIFAAGAVVQCDVDMERQLVFIVADKPEPEEPVHPCYFSRVEVFVEETGDDDNDDGGVDKPLRSIAGVFEFLKRNYFGITLNLVVNLGRGHFDAPRAWITPDFPCLVQSLHVYGKNGEDQNLTSTTVGDKGVEVYEYVRHIQFFNVSFRCSDEFNSVLYFPVNHCRISIRGWSECINQGSKSIDGITVLGHSYLMLGTDSGGDRIAFTGTFRKVIYVSSHSVANIPASPFFQGTSQFIIDATGMSSVHIYGSDPTFVGNFSGDIRALVGSTIGLSVTDPQRWLPTGANWIKDDISRITGQ